MQCMLHRCSEGDLAAVLQQESHMMHATPVLGEQSSSSTSVDCMLRVRLPHVGEVLRDQRVAEVDEDVQVRREGVDDGRDAEGGEVRQLRRRPVADVELDVRLGPDDRDVDPAKALRDAKLPVVQQKPCGIAPTSAWQSGEHHHVTLRVHVGLVHLVRKVAHGLSEKPKPCVQGLHRGRCNSHSRRDSSKLKREPARTM